MNQLVQAVTGAGSIVLMSLALVATGCQQPDHSQKLKPLIDKDVEVWNTGNVQGLDSILAPRFVRHENLKPALEGADGLKKLIAGLRSAFPDLKLVLDEEIYLENKAVIRWTISGTNTGPGGMPPTGKHVKVWGMDVVHFANGKITERWVAYDNQSVSEQLGFVMASPPAAKP